MAAAAQSACPGTDPGGTHPVTIDRFYSDRSIEILRLALADDHVALAPLVAPGFRFMIDEGDYMTVSRRSGAAGAVELVEALDPAAYMASVPAAGPVLVTQAKCSFTTTLLFHDAAIERGVRMRFRYRDGMLEEATGQRELLRAGTLER